MYRELIERRMNEFLVTLVNKPINDGMMRSIWEHIRRTIHDVTIETNNIRRFGHNAQVWLTDVYAKRCVKIASKSLDTADVVTEYALGSTIKQNTMTLLEIAFIRDEFKDTVIIDALNEEMN